MRRPAHFLPALVVVLGLWLPSTASAIPLLQLGIAGGTYNEATETTVASSYGFTLYAYLTPPNNTTAAQLQTMLNETYYIAAALTPRVTSPANLGSFSFNSTTVNATADMVYGTPPFESFDPGTQDSDSGDLQSHGIYGTYFKEFSLKFKSGSASATKNCGVNVNCTTPINVEDVVGTTPTPTANGTMYYMAFQVDTANLNRDYQVHFDLYSETFKQTCDKKGKNCVSDIDINKFAPFSHDAQSYAVPEPSTIALLGAGIVGLALRRRRTRTAR